MNFSFQGVPGAYSELAGRDLLGAKCRTLPCETFEAVFESVHRGRADRGIIPIENSLAGSIHQNYDLLAQHGLHIIGETYLRVEHALLGRPSARFQDIRQVRSHPQALAQCSGFFAKHKRIKPVVWFDTAGAAQSLEGEKSNSIAAIASEYAGKLYGLKVLRRSLQNQAVNFTRFLVISKNIPPLGGGRKTTRGGEKVKTSITFLPRKNEAGALFRILEIFALRNIDLSKIESRPDPKRPFDYRFYLDLAGGSGDLDIREALKRLGGITTGLRVLGSYPSSQLRTAK